eukprot:SAG31_NODE_11647_length_1010_cov_1.913282_3_plen_172_part_00
MVQIKCRTGASDLAMSPPAVALITGASRGFGRAVAIEYATRWRRTQRARDGASCKLVLTARDRTRLHETAALVEAAAYPHDDAAGTRLLPAAPQLRVVTAPLDLADLSPNGGLQQQLERVLAELLEVGWCSYALLINNAGAIEPLGPAAGHELSSLQRAFDVNVTAASFVR